MGIIVAGTNVVKAIHRMAGPPIPMRGGLGHHPGDFGREWPDGNLRNVVHTSDNPAQCEAGNRDLVSGANRG